MSLKDINNSGILFSRIKSVTCDKSHNQVHLVFGNGLTGQVSSAIRNYSIKIDRASRIAPSAFER
jgi:hypothetical protein